MFTVFIFYTNICAIKSTVIIIWELKKGGTDEIIIALPWKQAPDRSVDYRKYAGAPGERKYMKKDITIGEKYGKAMKITDKDGASSYFEECAQHTMSFGKSLEEAERIEHYNIGYYAGYYDRETAERANNLYGAVHPIFE